MTVHIGAMTMTIGVDEPVLVPADSTILTIAPTVEGMRAFGLSTIAAGHCTGWRAMTALANAFGDKVLAPTAVGKRYVF